MSLHICKFICHLISFQDKETWNDCWNNDKFACMRELFEDMNERNARTRHTSPLLGGDESCIHFVDTLDSSNTTQTNQLNMAYDTEVSAILQYLTSTILGHMLVNQRKLKIQVQIIASPKPTSIPNISSISCLYTATLKGSIHTWIATSNQDFRDGLQRKTSPLYAPWSTKERVSLKRWSQLVVGRKDLSCMFITQKRKLSLFFTLIKRKVVRRTSLYYQLCMIMSKLRKTSERNLGNLLSKTHSTRIKFRRWILNTLAFIIDTCRLNAKTILQDDDIKLTNFEMIYNLERNWFCQH